MMVVLLTVVSAIAFVAGLIAFNYWLDADSNYELYQAWRGQAIGLREELDASIEQNSKNEKEISTLRHDLDDDDKEIDEFEANFADLQAKHDALAVREKGHQEVAEHLARERDEAKKEALLVREGNDALRDELTTVKAERAALANTLRHIHDKSSPGVKPEKVNDGIDEFRLAMRGNSEGI